MRVLTESVKADRDAVSTAYSSCLASAAKRFDDYKSDPKSIARAMMSACKAEFDELVDVHSRPPVGVCIGGAQVADYQLLGRDVMSGEKPGCALSDAQFDVLARHLKIPGPTLAV